MEETKKKRGRQPSGIKHTTLILPEETRDSLRKVADYLAKQNNEKYSLHRAIYWMIEECKYYHPQIEPKTPDGEL